MKLVADTNILISALIKNSTNRKILFSSDFEFYVPEYAFAEISKHKKLILTKSRLDSIDYELFLNIMKEKVSIIPEKDVKKFLTEAKKIMDPIDEDDTAFIALALALQCPVWTNDSDFTKQEQVEVYSTEDLLERI